MSTMRGFAAGTLALIALEVFTTHAQAAGGLLGGASDLFQSFLSPDVPALHYKGNWPSSSGSATSTSTTTSTTKKAASPAHAAVAAGTQSGS